MTPQRFDQTCVGAGLALQRRQESSAVRPYKRHPFVLFEEAPCAFIRKIAGCKACNRHGLADDPLGRGRDSQLEAFGL